METAEVEKSTSSEDTSHLNRSRSFKSKQLVRSQAIRETHSPPRALSPAQPTSTNDNGTAAPTANNNIAAANVPNNVTVSANSVEKEVNDKRTVSVNDSQESSHVSVRCSDVVNSSDVKISDSDEFKKKLPVEIQITSGGWDEGQHERQRARRWHSDAPRDLLSNNPRVSCVCGTCAACVHCRGRRRRHYCSTKQDSGIVCSDDCPDCSDNEGGPMNDNMRKSNSLDVDDQPFYCRCPERKERPKNISLSRYDSDERYEPTGPELVAFIRDTLNKNMRDRTALLKIERELHALVSDSGRCIVRFPVMTSYGRMLVHRCAALFQLAHHPDQTNKTCVLVSKSGTSGGRLPCTSFKEWCSASFPPSPQRHAPEPPHAKSILKRDTHSLDEPGAGSLSSNRSKSLEQRERDYEKARRRIFSSQEEAQWPWLTSGPIKLLTPEGGGRNRLLKVSSLEGSGGGGGGSRGQWRGARGPVSKSHSFGGYAAAEPHAHAPRVLSRQGDLASSSWRLSPSSSGYKTLSLRSTDSITPSPTGGASPEPCPVAPGGAVTPGGGQAGAGQCGQAGAGLCGQAGPPGQSGALCGQAGPPGQAGALCGQGGAGAEPVVWAVTDMAAVPAGAVVIHPQTGRPLTNPDGSVYQFDPANPPVLYDPGIVQNDTQQLDPNNEKRRGRLEKQHSFIDNECECRPSEECRSKYCCECRRQDGCQRPTTEKETNTIPASPPHTTSETNTQTIAQESTNQQPVYEQTSNHKPEVQETQTNQRPYEVPNHKPLEVQRSYEPNNHQIVNSYNNRQVKITNQEHEMQYQHYAQGYRTEEMTSPPQMANHYVPQEMNMQVMTPAKLTPLPIPDPNIRQMSLTNMTNMSNVVYPTMAQGYPYQGRLDPSMQMYQQVVHTEEPKLAPSPHTNESAFRIDPSYPYAALEYPGPCGACVDNAAMQHQQRSYSAPYGPLEGPFPAGVLLQQPYPYQEQMPWLQQGGAPPAPKLVLPELYPVLQYPQPAYPHYNYVYPQQVVPQPYRICQPVYPVMEKQPEQRRNSYTPRPKRSSTSGSACNTPHPDDKVPYEDSSRQNSDIAVKIQQIKCEMAQLNTRGGEGKDRRREDWRRRNSGNGLLGNCPVNAFNGRVMGRGTSEDGHLSSAARAIVNSIRNMQAKNTYQAPRRAEPRAAPPSGLNVPLYRQPYVYTQMSPGTWCRRSPAPVHPALNHPRRPHPDNRNPRR